MRNFLHTFIISCLLLLIQSCNKGGSQDWGGMEHFDFELSGVVLNEDENPVKGIKVSAMNATAITSDDGTFSIKGSGGKDTTISLMFNDIDGIENGGLYSSTTVSVELDYIRGSHGPYLGLFGKSDIQVILNGRQQMPDTDIPLQ